MDVCELRAENIKVSFDGNLWIIKKRHKTNVTSNIRLLDIPKAILQKYDGKLPDGKILPVISNQKMNDYLKEIATVCGINKKITYHVARHITFSYSLKTRNLQRLSAWQVTIWKPAGFSILQCSASIKRTLLSFAKVVFFSLTAKTIPLKNEEITLHQHNNPISNRKISVRCKELLTTVH